MFMCPIRYNVSSFKHTCMYIVQNSWAEVNARTTNSWPQKRHSYAYKINIEWIIYSTFNNLLNASIIIILINGCRDVYDDNI